MAGAHVEVVAEVPEPEPIPLAWAVQCNGSPDIWETFPAEKYARQQLQHNIKYGNLRGPESDWEIFPIYRRVPAVEALPEQGEKCD